MLKGERIYVAIPVIDTDDDSSVVVTATGDLPSTSFQDHHRTLEHTVPDSTIRAVGRVASVEARLDNDDGKIIYLAKLSVISDDIQPGYRVGKLVIDQ